MRRSWAGGGSAAVRQAWTTSTCWRRKRRTMAQAIRVRDGAVSHTRCRTRLTSIHYSLTASMPPCVRWMAVCGGRALLWMDGRLFFFEFLVTTIASVELPVARVSLTQCAPNGTRGVAAMPMPAMPRMGLHGATVSAKYCGCFGVWTRPCFAAFAAVRSPCGAWVPIVCRQTKRRTCPPCGVCSTGSSWVAALRRLKGIRRTSTTRLLARLPAAVAAAAAPAPAFLPSHRRR